MAQHDNGYKNLFSHPEMVRDLLTGFVHEPWVAELDFATLEKVSGSAALLDWLQAPEQNSVRRAFAVWMKRVLLPSRLPGTRLPEVGDLLEVKTMLAETVMDWTQQWLQQGLEKGRQAEASLLLERQLTKRFGPLAPAVRARLTDASTQQLEDWAERILDAPNLEAVFSHGA